MPDFGIMRGFNDKLFGDKLYAGQLPTQLGLIGSLEFGFDPDAQAFFNRVIAAGGSLSATEQLAVDTLVKQMKLDGIWTKMKAIYPMVGASAAACSRNLKADEFNGTFTSGWTFASTGVTPTNAYFDTTLNDSTELALNSGSFGVYLNSFVNEKIPMLISDSINLVGTWVIERMTNSNVDVGFHDGLTSNAFGPVHTAGFYQVSRNNSTQLFFRTNNVLQTRSVNSIGLVNRTFKLGAYDNNGSFSQFMINQARFFYVGDGLTTTEQIDYYSAVQAFQRTLSRQV
jgi:hypothetical protein